MQLVITDQYLGQRCHISPAWTSRAWTPRGPWESLRRPLGLRLSGPCSKLKLQTRPGALRTSRSYLREAHWRNCSRLHPRWPLRFVHTRIYGVNKARPLAVINARILNYSYLRRNLWWPLCSSGGLPSLLSHFGWMLARVWLESFRKELFWFVLGPSQGGKHTLAQTLHTSTKIGLNNERKLKESISALHPSARHLVVSLQAAAAPANATRTDRWTVCTWSLWRASLPW